MSFKMAHLKFLLHLPSAMNKPRLKFMTLLSLKQTSVKIKPKTKIFLQENLLQNSGHFGEASLCKKKKTQQALFYPQN